MKWRKGGWRAGLVMWGMNANVLYILLRSCKSIHRDGPKDGYWGSLLNLRLFGVPGHHL